MPCRLEIRLVCKEWRSMCEMPQLWRSVYITWSRPCHCNEVRWSNLGIITHFFAGLSELQELSIDFRVPQCNVVSELITALGKSASLTKLRINSSSSYYLDLDEDKEIEKAGLLISCAIARLSTLQALYIYGLPVESHSFKPIHTFDTVQGTSCRLQADATLVLVSANRQHHTRDSLVH